MHLARAKHARADVRHDDVVASHMLLFCHEATPQESTFLLLHAPHLAACRNTTLEVKFHQSTVASDLSVQSACF